MAAIALTTAATAGAILYGPGWFADWQTERELLEVVSAEDEVAFPEVFARFKKEVSDRRPIRDVLEAAFESNDHTVIAEGLLESFDGRTNGEIRRFLTKELSRRVGGYYEATDPMPWIDLLLKKGADPNPVIAVAAANGNVALIQRLTEAGGKPNYAALAAAVERDHIAVVQYLRSKAKYSKHELRKILDTYSNNSSRGIRVSSDMIRSIEDWSRSADSQ